jgi:hypothetical protein
MLERRKDLYRRRYSRLRENRRQRQRRHRERVRAGVAIAPTPYTDEIVDALVRWNRLGPAEAYSREEIGEAMFEALIDAARRE